MSLNCNETTSCNLSCNDTNTCKQALVTSSSDSTSITCDGGESPCEEIIVDCQYGEDCDIACIGGTNSCVGASIQCPKEFIDASMSIFT